MRHNLKYFLFVLGTGDTIRFSASITDTRSVLTICNSLTHFTSSLLLFYLDKLKHKFRVSQDH